MGNRQNKIQQIQQIQQFETTCEQIGCNAIVIPDTMTCPLHICGFRMCSEIRADGKKYCMFHLCSTKGCDQLAIDYQNGIRLCSPCKKLE